MKVLLVGGTDAIKTHLAVKFSPFDLEIMHHWGGDGNYGSAQSNWPTSIDLVIMLTSHISHSLSDNAKELARKNKIPVINSEYEWSRMSQKLSTAGYLKRKNEPAAPTKTVEPIKWIPQKSSAEELAQVQSAVVKEVAKIEVPVLPITTTRIKPHSAERAKEKRAYVRELLKGNTTLNNNQILQAVARRFSSGLDYPVIDALRAELGMPKVRVYQPRTEEQKAFHRLTRTDGTAIVVGTRQEAIAAIKAVVDPLADVKAAIELLKDAMFKQNMSEIHLVRLDDAIKVNFKRVVVSEGTLDV